MNETYFKDKVPAYVFEIVKVLTANKFKSYLVGGSLRDILLDIDPDDYDLATDALPEQIEAIFPKSIPTGAAFGTITVLVDDEKGETHDIQVTTFRSEQEYRDGRWPTKVEYSKNIDDDLKRRDFTINSLALDLTSLIDDVEGVKLIDLFGGQEDIDQKLIKAVGDPLERLTEDGLRALRACRLASTLEFEMEPKLYEAIKQTLHVTSKVSIERVRDELDRMLKESPKPSRGLKLMKECGLLKIFIPELLEGEGITQPEFHIHDVFQHALDTVDKAEDSIKWAALLHDIGKSRTQNEGHFYRHDIVGSEMARQIMTRLRFPKAEVERVARLIRWHMFYYPYDEDEIKKNGIQKDENDLKYNRDKKRLDQWNDSAIRRFIRSAGGDQEVEDLIRLRIADAVSNPKSSFDPTEIDILSKRIAEVRQKDMALTTQSLDITGHDIINMGIEAGPKIKEIMEHLLEMVIDDPMLNKKEILLNEVKKYQTSTHPN